MVGRLNIDGARVKRGIAWLFFYECMHDFLISNKVSKPPVKSAKQSQAKQSQCRLDIIINYLAIANYIICSQSHLERTSGETTSD